MTDKVGILAKDVVDAAQVGLPYAGRGYAVRIFTARADLAALPAQLAQVRADVVILVTNDDRAREAEATAALQRWGATIPAEHAPAEHAPAVAPAPFDPLAGVDLSHPGGTLVIAGSYAPPARAQVDRLGEADALILTVHREAVLNQDESYLMGVRSGAGAALRQGRNVAVRSENWPEAPLVARKLAAQRMISADELARRVRTMLARVGQGVLAANCTRTLIAVGTETSAALCEQLGILELVLVRAVAPGLPALWVAGPLPLLLVVKAGSSGEPDDLVQAIAQLRG